jgi:hypothetical protein
VRPSAAQRRREDLFQRIAGRRGGAAGVLLSDRVLREATAKLDELRPLALDEIRQAIGRIRALAETRTSAEHIFMTAHDVRGLAGAYGFVGVGVVAGAIRTYGEHPPEGFEPDWSLIQLLSMMLARAFDHPGEAPAQTLQSGCRLAVTRAMGREGREPSEGAL